MLERRLAAARKRCGMRQVDLAAVLGVGSTMISMAESGDRRLTLEGAAKAARALNVSLDYLGGLTDDPAPAAELAARAKHLAQLCLAWRYPRIFGDPGLANDQGQMQKLQRRIEEIATEIARE